MIKTLRAMDRNELLYWLGLALLFAGLALGVSVATALTVIGGVIAAESVLTSYLAMWIQVRS